MLTGVQQSFDDLGTPLSEVTFVVVDVETTGGSPAMSSLTEVAAARYRGGELLGTFQTFVRPDRRIPPFITALTGINDEMVADAPRVGEMLPALLEFVGGAVLVGHNLRFDLSFLNHALECCGHDPFANKTVDTLALARRLVRDRVPDCTLGGLAASLRLEHQPSHRALADVHATADLLHSLLEHAGTFGILGLEELLRLPRLLGHPQAAKLALTTRLPHRPGVYWFTDAAGHVLYVGKATDIRARVRSYFSGDSRRKVGRLLRQLHGVHCRVCPGPLTAAVLEGRLIRSWAPPYNAMGKVKRRATDEPGSAPVRVRSAKVERRYGRRRKPTPDELASDPVELLAPLAEEVRELSEMQRFEEAGALRDEADRLRHLFCRHRWVASLQDAGRLVLLIDGEGDVELDRGLLVESGTLFDWNPTPADGGGARASSAGATGEVACLAAALAMTADGHDAERVIVAQWLRANAGRVRILDVEAPHGLSMPVDRIPSLRELL